MAHDYEQVLQCWEEAAELAGDDRFKRALVRGLHNLTAQLEVDMAEIRQQLSRLNAGGIQR